MPDRLHLDFETRSELDLQERGLHNYATHPSTQVLMLAWTLNDRAVQLWEPHRGEMPAELAEALADPFVEKPAWNSPFERTIFRHVLKMDIPVDEWVDPSVWARYLSLPAGLEDAGEVLGLSEDDAKIKEGKDLIQLFCVPKAMGGGDGLFGSLPTVWNDWRTHPEAWARFCEYGRQDVRTERAIAKKITKLQPPASERAIWVVDQIINERGMPVDMELVAGAAKVAAIERGLLDERLRALTGLENPGSVTQMLGWVRQHGYPFNALGKAFVQRALRGEGELTPEGREALLLRTQASKSSVHKLEALRNLVAEDGRVRHQFVFYGAATLRWGSRGVQLQNLPRPTKEVEKNLDKAIGFLRAGDHSGIAGSFTSPLDTVVSCLRPMFRAPAGKKFIVADLNAIENRVLGWLSRSPAMLSVYAEGRCPYIDFATELYGQSYEELWHEYKVEGNSAKRTMSKPAVLACGYRLSGGEVLIDENGDEVMTGLLAYANGMGVSMTPEEAQHAVDIFRARYPEVKQYWDDLDNASLEAVRNTGQDIHVGQITFRCTGKRMLQALLPSGRSIHYLQPEIEQKEITFFDRKTQRDKTFTKDTLTYMGKDQQTKQWVRKVTHGGHLTENFCQAIARDVLVNGILLAESRGIEVVGHVHDEIVSLVDADSRFGAHDLEECMRAVPSWAGSGDVREMDGTVIATWPALPLDAEGYEDNFYRKG